MTQRDWHELADLVHTVLVRIYVEDRAGYERLATVRGATLEQLAAGTVAEAVRVRLSATGVNGG